MTSEVIDLTDTLKIVAEQVEYDAFGSPVTIVGTIIAWELVKGAFRWVTKTKKVTVKKEIDKWVIREPIIEEEWVSTRKYIEGVVNRCGVATKPKIPIRRYINIHTLICNDVKAEPSGDFSACCYYYVVSYDGTYHIHKFSVQYRSYARARGNLREYLKTVELTGKKYYCSICNKHHYRKSMIGIEHWKYISLKYALHAFRGKTNDLLTLYRDKVTRYEYDHFLRPKEGIKRRLSSKIRSVLVQKASVRVKWNRERMMCGLTKEEALEYKELCCYPDCFNCAYVE